MTGREAAHEEERAHASAPSPLTEVAQRLPEIVDDVDRIAICWKVLASPRTARWKRVLVGLELIRLMIIKRLRKPAPIVVHAEAPTDVGGGQNPQDSGGFLRLAAGRRFFTAFPE